MLLGEPYLTNRDATMLPQPWVKWAYRAGAGRGRSRRVHAGLRDGHAATGGPVFLSIPLDDWDNPASVLRSCAR